MCEHITGVRECVNHELLTAYPVLTERPGTNLYPTIRHPVNDMITSFLSPYVVVDNVSLS
jgi:hypothetical protein